MASNDYREKFREITDRSIVGLFLECAVCGQKLTRSINIFGMNYRDRILNGDEELQHFIETAGFEITDVYSDPIALWVSLAHERGGHSAYKALKHCVIYRSAEDKEWMDKYSKLQKEILEKFKREGALDFLDDKDF